MKKFVLHLMLVVASASAQGVITTTAGTTWIFRSDGGAATGAPLGNLSGVAVDAAGNVYVADFSNDLVVRISPAGLLTVVAGNGFRGFSGDGGPAASASLFSPSGVAVDSAGNVYIADTLNHRIRKVSNGTITTYAGLGMEFPGFAGDGGPATSARLNAPGAVSVDSAGNLYIADTFNHRIRKVTTAGIISTVAGNGIRGFSGDNGLATAASLSSPSGVFADSSGSFYIADKDNHRIRRVTSNATIVTVAGSGNAGFSGDGGQATSAQMRFPSSVFLDSGGNLVVADSFNNCIRRITAAGVISTVAGVGNSARAFAGDGGQATSATLNNPRGAAVDVAGSLLIADTFNSRLRRVAGGIITTIAGNAFYKFSGDGGPATSAALNSPKGLVADSAGNLYFADQTNNRVRRINATGIISTVAGTGVQGFSGDGGSAAAAALNSPVAVALDAGGNLYIADSGNNRIRKVSPAQIITTAAGTDVAGFSGDGGSATAATLNGPAGVAIDTAGNLYISDAGNQRVRRVNAAGNISAFAGNGTPGFAGDNGPGTSAQLNSPGGLTVDTAGTVYVADSSNHRIRRITSAGTISTVAGSGTDGFSGDGGLAVNAQLYSPSAVAIDAAGNLLIADTSNHRIRKVTGGSISSVAGNGIGQFFGDGGPATAASLNQPLGVAADAAGNVFISDTLNDRIRVVLATTPTFTAGPSTLSFSAAAGTPLVGAQNIDISSAISGLGYSASATTTSGGNWLSISPASGSLPASLAASVNLSGLVVGTYQGSITVNAPLASPSTRTVNVSLTVTGSTAAQLSVEPFAMTFDVPAGSGNPSPQTLRIANAGSGTLNWSAVVAPGASWLTVSPSSGSATTGTPSTAQLSVNVVGLAAGVYSGVVQVGSAGTGQSQSVAVTLLVAQVTQTILLSRNGLYFTGVEGGGAIPTQDFGILNIGQGTMNWTVDSSTIAGGSWLSVSPTSGSSQANSLTIPLVDVGANVGALTTKLYSGLIRVLGPAANNSPQLMSVNMNVLPAGANPGVVVRPTGLIFAARAGSSSPGSQTVRLSTASPRGMEARAGVSTFEGNWLDVRPANIALSGGETRTLTIQPTLGSLTPGQYRGALALVFNDGTPAQVVNVLFVVVPAATAAADGDGVPGAFETCVPRKLFAVFRNLPNNFASSVGYPNTLEAQVVDDCGSAVPNATVVASFSNGDPSLVLVSLGNGIYTGNWRPINQSGRVTVTVRAQLPGLERAEIQAQGAIAQNATAPVLYSGGIVNAASFATAQALAPGSIVSVFGQVLAASQSQATTVPLPITMAGATMTVGGTDVPLFFTSDGQINAQLPFELPPNSRQQVVVKGSQFLTVPETVTIAAARPGIFTVNQQGNGQGAILNTPQNVLVDSRAPAAAGEVVQVFLTGMGPTNPAVPSGRGAPVAEPLARVTTLPVQATVGGIAATVEFAGLAPGFVGLYQVNVRIPNGVAPGSAVPLVISQAGVASNTVTLAVR